MCAANGLFCVPMHYDRSSAPVNTKVYFVHVEVAIECGVIGLIYRSIHVLVRIKVAEGNLTDSQSII